MEPAALDERGDEWVQPDEIASERASIRGDLQAEVIEGASGQSQLHRRDTLRADRVRVDDLQRPRATRLFSARRAARSALAVRSRSVTASMSPLG